MVNRIFVFLSAIILATQTSPAASGSDFAQWAFAPEQVAAASGSRLKPCDVSAAVCTVRLPGYHPTHYTEGLTISGLAADASFTFEAGKLARTVVRFGGDGRNVRYLQGALSKTYGAPLEVKKTWMPYVLWRDETKGSAINLIDLSPNYVLVDYSPLHEPR
jgi:hypothetical protein